MSNKNYAIVKISILGVIAVLLALLLIVLLSKDFKWKFSFVTSEDYKLVYSEEFDASMFEKLAFDLKSADVDIVYSNNDKIKLEIYDNKDDAFNVKHDDGVLSVKLSNINDFCFGFCFIDRHVKMYLPMEFKGDLNIISSSGDIQIDDYENMEAVIKTSSGSVDIKKISSVNVRTTSGDITVLEAKRVDANSTSGEMVLRNIPDLKFESTSGDVSASNLNKVKGRTTSGEFEANDIIGSIEFSSTSGDVDLVHVTLEDNSSISTVSGEVSVGLTKGVFIDATSVSGDKDIYNSDRNSDVTLKISTTSGDIEVG